MSQIQHENSPIISPQRRRFLKLGLLTGATGAFTVSLNRSSQAGARGQRDVAADAALLAGAIELEQRAVNTYTAAAENNLLPTQAFLDVAVQFAGDHTQHRDRLARVLSDIFKMEPPDTSNLGTFPIPETVLTGGEAEVIRYALSLEMIASKAYLDYIQDKLTTDEAINLVATIMPIETMHAAVYRTVLATLLNEPGLSGDGGKIVPKSFLSEEPTPPLPEA